MISVLSPRVDRVAARVVATCAFPPVSHSRRRYWEPYDAVVAISPPQTGSGGLAAGASSTSLLGLAVLIAGAGLLGWALRLSTRR
jgi:hypothetical protein